MACIKNFGDFKLYQPTEEEAAAAEKTLGARQALNQRIISENPCPAEVEMSITGTFISAHAPDYIGVPTVHWQIEDWRREFQTMKSYGIDTVILQSSAWKELEESYFVSETLKDFHTFNVVKPLIEAAEAENMMLFVGGFGSVAGWDLQDKEKTAREMELHEAVLRELAMLGKKRIAGFYFPCETAFRGERRVEHETQYCQILGRFCNIARELLPGKPIIMSPSSKYFEGKDDDFIACWKNLFSVAAPDILAPQDSIGCGGSNLANQSAMWALWKKLADETGCRLWANIELFERRIFGGEDPFDAASPERVKMQLANVADYVEKCVCWEFSYFVNGKANGSEKLRKNW